MIKKRAKQSLGMVDISQKNPTLREAKAQGVVYLGTKAFKEFISNGSPKGDVLESAKIAGIMAAKNTPMIIPLCHPLNLSKVKMEFLVDRKKKCITVESHVNCFGQTGVEMEALAAVSAATLTIYDMMKWADKGILISDIKLSFKSGGKSGTYKA